MGRRCRAAMLSTMARHGAASFARRAMSPATCPATSPKLTITSCDIASDMSAHRQRCRQRQKWTFRDIADNGITCRQRHGAMYFCSTRDMARSDPPRLQMSCAMSPIHTLTQPRYGATWRGATWRDMARHGAMWRDMARCGATWRDVAQYEAPNLHVASDVARHGS